MRAAPRLLLPAALLLGHAWLYHGWIVDDAGISLAYARNLAAGHGLVAQVGAAPVEGYSNPAWVLLLAALELCGVGSGPGVLEALGLSLTVLSLGLLLGLARRLGEDGEDLGVACACLLALNPAFVLWCVSGLENPLTVAAALGMAELCCRSLEGAPRAPVGLGLLAAVLALNRPEGLLYALAPLAVAVWAGGPLRSRSGEQAYLGALGLPLLAYLGVRLAWFHALLPNTYWAKGGPDAWAPARALLLEGSALEKALALSRGLVGPELATWGLVVAPLLAGGFLLRRGARPAGRVVLVLATPALAAYLLLPQDWMGELRFATAALPLVLLVALGAAAPRRPGGPGALALLLLLAAAPALRWRALQASLGPPVSLELVRRAYVERFGRWAAALEVPAASVLLPDVGAMLLESSLVVHDLAGLCDRRLARLLHGPRAGLREYVLGELRPTFMHLDPFWAPELMLAEDSRLGRDYVSLHRYPPHPDFPFRGAAPGLYLRREVAERHPGVVAAIRAEPHGFGALARPAPLGWLVRMVAGLPLPARSGWLPAEEPGSRLPGRRRGRHPSDALPAAAPQGAPAGGGVGSRSPASEG